MLSGTEVSAEIKTNLKNQVESIRREYPDFTPGLVIVQVHVNVNDDNDDDDDVNDDEDGVMSSCSGLVDERTAICTSR